MSRSNECRLCLLRTRSQCRLLTSAHKDRHFCQNWVWRLLFMNKKSELAKSLGHYSINSGRAVMPATAKCITAGRSLASLFSIQPDCTSELDVWIPIQGEPSLSTCNCFAGFAKSLCDRNQSYLRLQWSLAMPSIILCKQLKIFRSKSKSKWQHPNGNVVSGETCTKHLQHRMVPTSTKLIMLMDTRPLICIQQQRPRSYLK